MTGALLETRRFDVVDLSALAPPALLEQWSFDAILAARIDTFLGLWREEQIKNPALPDFDTTILRGNPFSFHQRVDAFREGLVRQRVNEAALSTFLLFATGADLDARAAEYNTVRASGESDDSLRLRALLAWENLSIGGSYGGYEYRTRSVAPAAILDVGVYGAEVEGVPPGEVRIVLLGNTPGGNTSPALLTRVRAALTARATRKVNDRIRVEAAQIIPYRLDATLVVPKGVDGRTVRDQKLADAQIFVAARKIIGGAVTPAGVMAAIGGYNPRVVVNVELRAPFAGLTDLSTSLVIGGGPFDVPVCTAISLQWRTP